jgi:hypothetical protein
MKKSVGEPSRGNGFWGAERISSLKLTSTPWFCSLGKNNFRKKLQKSSKKTSKKTSKVLKKQKKKPNY